MKKIRVEIARDVSTIIKNTIAVDSLPKEFKIGMGCLRKQIIDYILKSDSLKKIPDWVVTLTANRVRGWYDKGLITKTQANDILNDMLKNW